MRNCPSCLHPGSCCQRMLPPRLVSYFEKAALQLHIWPYVQILDMENSPNRCQGHATLERKKPHTFQRSLFCANKQHNVHTGEIQVVPCLEQLGPSSHEIAPETHVLLLTQNIMRCDVWCIFKDAFNTKHLTQKPQLFSLQAQFWSNVCIIAL